LKVWNMFLVIFTFSAVIFGTFATRSGLVSSVHAFARSPIGQPMLIFWASLTLISVGLLLWRWGRGELKDEHRFAHFLSRETLFVLNNVVFVMLFVVIFWGSFGMPILSEQFMNTNVTLGKDYFMSVTPVLFLALYILMGIAPLSAWGTASLRRLGKGLLVPLALTLILVAFFALTGTTSPGGLFGYGVVSLAGFVAIYETYRGVMARRRGLGDSWWRAITALFARNRRRYGGYVIHLGIAVIGLGVIGSTLFQQETQQTLAAGQSLTVGGYSMTYNKFERGLAADGHEIDMARVSINRNGQKLADLSPHIDLYADTSGANSSTIAGIYSTLENDFYVILVGWNEVDASSATFKVFINPLINLVWWGGIILIIGTFVAAWPNEPSVVEMQRAPEPSRKHAGATA
jgi:cytochrome c-type biogenesis protein CcmF